MKEKEHELLMEQVMAKLEHIDSMFDIAQESPLDEDFSSSVSTWSTTLLFQHQFQIHLPQLI
jgi:hypothetical protein